MTSHRCHGPAAARRRTSARPTASCAWPSGRSSACPTRWQLHGRRRLRPHPVGRRPELRPGRRGGRAPRRHQLRHPVGERRVLRPADHRPGPVGPRGGPGPAGRDDAHLRPAWGVTHAGLFTFPQSPKHLALYQSYGFLPRFLTPVLAKPPLGRRPGPPKTEGGWSTAGQVGRPRHRRRRLRPGHRRHLPRPGRQPGRSRRPQPRSSATPSWSSATPAALDAFAVCHTGAGSEAGTGTCFVKFGAALPGPGADGPLRPPPHRLRSLRRPPGRPGRRRRRQHRPARRPPGAPRPWLQGRNWSA